MTRTVGGPPGIARQVHDSNCHEKDTDGSFLFHQIGYTLQFAQAGSSSPADSPIQPADIMLSSTEKTLLKELLALAPVPEQTLSYNELMGFMFGLAITPVTIPDDEWMSAIFGEDESGISALDQARSMSTVLSQVYSTFLAKHEQGELNFPYQLETLEQDGLEEVLEWVSGLDEALALRPDLWEPDEYVKIEPRKREELFFSMMVVQGLVDPVEIKPFFDKMPDEVFAEAFTTFEQSEENRDMQIQAFLLATLPLAIQTLQEYAAMMRKIIPQKDQPSVETAMRKGFAERPMESAAQPKAKSSGTRKSNVIRVDFSRGKGAGPKTVPLPTYQLKVAIKGAKPPIWRRILVPGRVTLAQLHEIIQVSMGWFDSHLHHFVIGGAQYGPILEDDWGADSINDETLTTLHAAVKNGPSSFDYTYDFGDNWQHKITIEKVLASAESKPYPEVLKGKRACPPEDIGGIWGYQEFLEAYTDPSHDDHAAMVDWAGPDFRPELFDSEDINEINTVLKEMFG